MDKKAQSADVQPYSTNIPNKNKRDTKRKQYNTIRLTKINPTAPELKT